MQNRIIGILYLFMCLETMTTNPRLKFGLAMAARLCLANSTIRLPPHSVDVSTSTATLVDVETRAVNADTVSIQHLRCMYILTYFPSNNCIQCFKRILKLGVTWQRRILNLNKSLYLNSKLFYKLVIHFIHNLM